MTGSTDGLAQRIANLVERVGGQGRAAEIAEVSRATIQTWRAGKARPPLLEVARLAAVAGVSLEWIATGEQGHREPSPEDEVSTIVAIMRMAPSEECQALIREGDASGALIAIDESWLKQRKIGKGEAGMLTIAGDEMSPTLVHGDRLILHLAAKRVVSGGIYVLVRGDAAVVRRAQILLDGTTVLRCDNARYGEEKIPPGQPVAVAGRVLAVFRET